MKRTVKTILSILLLLMLLALVACDNGTNTNGAQNGSPGIFHTHEWKEATCTSPRTCSGCEMTEGEALGHDWKAATCTTPKTCSDCDATEGAALGHNWQDATCTEPKTCSVCAETKGIAVGHSWISATCTTPKTCSDCETTEGDARGHDWKAATCTAPKTCSDCDATEGEALGHDWEDATCTAPKTCSDCEATEGEALGHDWKAATCTAPKTCSDCDATEGEALGHSYSEAITTPATCNTQGVKTFTCAPCGNSYTEPFALASLTADTIYETVKNSIGEIITYNRSGNEIALGTGFVYSADGIIITNYHVIEDAYSATITLAETEYTVTHVLSYSKTIDLALLKIDATDLIPLSICKKEHVVGKTVYAFGSSRGLTSTFSQGIITYALRKLDGVNYVQHDAAISGGNSGGPLINEYGEVIGINTMTIRDSQNLNFAIAISEIENIPEQDRLTFEEFYEKECDVYNALKNYAVNSGTYSAQYNWYQLELGRNYSSDYSIVYIRILYYDLDSDSIILCHGAVSDDMTAFVIIEIDEVDGIYQWSYSDSFDYEMSGTLYANTYSSSSLLGYSHNNIYSSSVRSSVRELSSTLVNGLCLYLDSDFSEIGVTAEDLGFLYY